MKTTGKSRLGLKKALLLILYFCGILLISFFAFVYFLFKSPSFLDRAEQIINRQSKMPIEIGALSLTGWGRIAIKDLTLRESEKGEPIVVIPYAEIGLSPSVLFKKHIDEIEIKKPKLFITLKGRKDGEIKKGWPSLPFYLKKISIEDGEVIVRNETGMLVSFSGFALSIKEMPGRKAEVLASGDLRAPELRKEALQIIFKGEYDIDKFELDIENISISSPLAGAADIKGRLSMFPFKMQAELTADRVDLNKVVKKFVNILPDKGFALQGTAALRSAVSVDMSEGISGTISAIIDNGGFSSSDGAMAGEGIAVNLSGDLKYSLKDNTTEFSVTTHASDFELLLGSFYGDFTEKEISCSVQGKYFKNNDTLKISASEFSITDIGTIGASGDIRSISKTPRIDLDVRLKELANADAFAFFVQETFQDRFPFLSQMGISGKTSARLSVNGTKDAFNIQGNIDIKDADVFAEKSGLSVQGVNMSLPLDLSYPKITAPKKEAERFGSIRIRNISWKKQQAERIEFYPAVWQNTLVFKEDIQIPVFAGNIKLKNISYEKLLSPDRELHMSIDMNGIDLEQVSSSFNIPQFSGSLTGEIPSASITKGSLLTNGE
ncbi:MAG TPA: hypothetical protein ENG80_06020, partial [Nitrospirae bacterium]|nr:hypothetical protein [Nitrospirota bacterium]